MCQTVDEYRIESYTRFSWGYVYSIKGKRHELWAESAGDLKRKALAKGLPWDDSKVPKVKPKKATSTYMGMIVREGTPASFRLPWCKSNYKRY